MTGMITDARQFLDQNADSGQGPQIGAMARGQWSIDEGFYDLLFLRGTDFSLTPRLALAAKGLLAAFAPGLFPTMRHLPSHSEPATDLRS